MLTRDEIDEVIRQIATRLRPQKIIIFGSYAKGKATVESDLDVFVIHETHLPMANRADDLRPVLDHRLIPVDVHVYTPEEVEEYGKEAHSFVASVLRTGQVVFDAEASRARSA